MKNLEQIKSILSKNKKFIQKNFGVKELYIFGSYVRGEETTESDIDILVEFEKGRKNFKNYMGLKFYLEELLGKKIDLVTKKGVRKELKKYIFNEAVNV